MTQTRTALEQNRCSFCHQRNYSEEENVRACGHGGKSPGEALRDFKGDTQPGYDPSRADVLYSISEAPTLDLAYYLARLR